MLCSRIVASLSPIFESTRNRVMEMTATGIDALTVRPTLRTRYREDAPKTTPSNAPTISGNGVSSRRVTPAGMYGRNPARKGFSGFVVGTSVVVPLIVFVDIRIDLRELFAQRSSSGASGRDPR